MEKQVYKLIIDPELRDFIPPLTDLEYENLEELIMLDGCEEALTVWDGVIIDGHNRYRICHEHNVPFAIREKNFESKEQAKLWMARKQLGRRNLKPFQKCELVIPLEEAIKKEAEKHRREKISETLKRGRMVQETAPSTKTRDILAEMADVSHDTINKAKVIIQQADEDMKNKLRRGELKIGAAYKKLQEEEPKKSEPKRMDNVPAIQVDGPIIFNNNPELDEKKEYFSPADFGEIEAQVEICIQDFMMNFRETMKWIGQQHLSSKNESSVKTILKEGYEAAVDTLHDRFVELKETNK